MMECVDEFVDSGVLQAVHQRTDKVKIARTAKVEEMMKALNPKEAANAAKRVEKEAAAVQPAPPAPFTPRLSRRFYVPVKYIIYDTYST